MGLLLVDEWMAVRDGYVVCLGKAWGRHVCTFGGIDVAGLERFWIGTKRTCDVHVHIFVSGHVDSYLHGTSELLVDITGTRNSSGSEAIKDKQAEKKPPETQQRAGSRRWQLRATILTSFFPSRSL